MKVKSLLILAALTFMANAFSQNTTIGLTFTAENNGTYIQMDSVKVMNRTQGGYMMLHWPDTTLTLDVTPGDLYLYVGYITALPVGTGEINQDKEQFRLFQNYPNPGKDQHLDKGSHSFRFTPGGDNIYLFTARWNGISRSIKILVTAPSARKACVLEYTGTGNGGGVTWKYITQEYLCYAGIRHT
jgi:hypothetical protein